MLGTLTRTIEDLSAENRRLRQDRNTHFDELEVARSKQAERDLEGLRERECAALETVPERAAGHERHDEERPLGREPRVEDRDEPVRLAELAEDPRLATETRRLADWFDHKFDYEVTQNILFEKVFKRLMHYGPPNSDAIRVGKDNIHYHLDYIGYLAAERYFLAGDNLTNVLLLIVFLKSTLKAKKKGPG